MRLGLGLGLSGGKRTRVRPPVISMATFGTLTDTTIEVTATVNPMGAPATVTVEYGVTTAYGLSATCTESPLIATGTASATLTGLISGTTYHFRFKAANTAGTIYSGDVSVDTDFVAEAKALFVRTTDWGVLTPELIYQRKKSINRCIVGGKAHGWWAKGDVLQVYANASQQASLLNWIADANNGANMGATFTASRGFNGNGSSTYVNTNFNPSAAAKYTVNSATIIMGCLTSDTTGGLYSNGVLQSGTYSYITPLRSNLVYATVNSTNFNVTGASSNSKGYFAGIRTSATNNNVFRNKTMTSVTDNSNISPNGNFWVGGINYIDGGGIIFRANNYQYNVFFAGSALTQEEYNHFIDDIEGYMSSVGAQIIGEPVPTILLFGQSNARGVTLSTSSLPTAWQGVQPDLKIVYSGTLQAMNPGTNTGGDQGGTTWGIEQALCHDMVDKSGMTPYVVKNAWGAMGIAMWDEGQTMWNFFNTDVTATITQMAAAGKYPVFIPIWIQGELDAGGNPPAYQAKLLTLIDRVRAYHTYLATSPFFILKLWNGTPGNVAVINAAFDYADANKEDTFALNPNPIPGITRQPDLYHYTDASYIILGHAFYDFIRANGYIR